MSKSVDGEFWKAIRYRHGGCGEGRQTRHTAIRPDDQITMTFEGASNEQDVEKQIKYTGCSYCRESNGIVFQQATRIPARPQIEAAKENGISVVAF